MRIHATCVVIGEAGILIRGPSGSGKSTLARQLLDAAERAGLFARLVSDDCTEVEVRAGRAVARAVPPIEGKIEVRGVGILERGFEPAALIRLVVDCATAPGARLPHESESSSDLGNARVPRLVDSGEARFAEVVLWRLRDLEDTPTTV